MIALRRALLMAKLAGIKEVRMHPGWALFTRPFTLHGITVTPSTFTEAEKSQCITWKTFQPVSSASFLNLTWESEFRDIFAEQMGGLVKDMDDETLLIHIQSGDLFRRTRTTPCDYAQPPCAFYKDIINMRSWSNVLLFSEDERNPCVRYVKKLGAVMQNANISEVVGMMIGGKNIVFGRGTLGISFAGVAKDIHRLYTFNMSTGQFRSREHYNCVPTNLYHEKVILNFMRTKEQLDLMKTEKCDSWESIKYDPGPRSFYVFEKAI